MIKRGKGLGGKEIEGDWMNSVLGGCELVPGADVCLVVINIYP